jgi:hypothetical protein
MKIPSRLTLSCLLAFGWQIGAMAQQAAPDQTTTTTTTTTTATKTPVVTTTGETNVAEQTVELSPFEVNSTKDNGYAATETLAGTRIATNLADVAASISVYNKDFLNDINATGAATLLQYTTNGEVAGPYGSYTGLGNGQSVNETTNLIDPEAAQRIRGLAAADNARNYFITDIPWDSYNTDRVDVLRGPNSILYGLGSPAGIINGSTNNAEFRDEGSIDFESDSYGTFRETLDINQQLIPGVLAIRLDAETGDQKFEQRQAFSDDNRYYGALRFDPQLFKNRDFQTSIKASFEHGNINADRPRTVPPNDGITTFWRPTAVSASNPFGGMGQQSVNNPYDPWRTDSIVAGNGYGSVQSGTVNYQPYLTDQANAQQPIWFMDGATGSLLEAFGGYINNGFVNTAGAVQSISSGVAGRVNSGMFYGISNLSTAAIGLGLPGNQYGQYKNQSLTNPSVFNFYRNLIDGPTADQWEGWNAFNVDFTQTGWDNRVGLDLTYDRQHYNRGGQNLIGGSPTLTLDITKNLADYYVTGANGETSVTNPNYGRPYVTGAANSGAGSAYESDREVKRASLFLEVRPSDWTSNPFILELLGKQRLNGVVDQEEFYDHVYGWQMYANSLAWSNYWNQGNGASESIADRPPVGVFYLGSSVINAASPNGLNIPGITHTITLPNAGIDTFNSTYISQANPAAPWTPGAGLAQVFPTPTLPAGGLSQNSNPANYIGWQSNFVDNLVTDNNGDNPNLYNLDQLAERVTKSYSGNYQGSFWNDALIATLGWRYDTVETRDITAGRVTLNQAMLDTTAQDFQLPGTFPASEMDSGHSTSGGVVLHLNRLLKNDPLPINVSLSYNDSKNFQVTNIRRDIYGNPFGNPTGKTKEYGIRLSTKNGMFSVAVDKYTTDVINGSSTLGNAGGAGSIVQQGMRYRNVYLYSLGGYTISTENQPASRNIWTSAYPAETIAQAATEEDAAISTWNSIQLYMTQQGFFNAWGYTPTTPSVLTTESQYLTNPGAYQPAASTVAAYVGTAPQGFTVTSNADSRGNELDLTANPLPNWRISVNGAETTAIQTDVGGQALTNYVNYLTPLLINTSTGVLTPAGKMAQFGNPSFALYPNVFAPWLASYNLLKLQEGTDDPELRKWRFNIVTNYTFNEGFLKNVGVGGAYRWQSKVEIGYPLNTTTGVDNLANPYYGPSLGSLDLWVSYDRKVTKHVDWKIQLNIRNAFANNGLIPISIEPDGKTWATVRTNPPMDFELNNTFSF